MADRQEVSIHFPKVQNFTCTSCGKCCQTDWRVKVHDAEARVIEGLRVYGELKRQGYTPLHIVDDHLQLNRRENLDCHFLEEQRCLIHQESGPSAKPAPCRLFPFQLVGTPDGYFASLSFSCPAVISGDGDRVEQQVEDLALAIQEAPHFFPENLSTNSHVTIVEGVKLPWGAYLAYEATILKLVEESTHLSDTLLHVAAVIADSITGHKAPDYQINPTPQSKTLQENLKQLLPMLTSITIAHLEEFENLERRQEVIGGLAGNVGFESNLLNSYALPFSQIKPLDQIAVSILKRYVFGTIFGKTLTTGPSFLSRLLYLAVSLQVFTYYLGCKKALSQSKHFSQSEVEWCFDLLENEARHHQDILTPVFLEWENDLLGFGRQLNEPQPLNPIL